MTVSVFDPVSLTLTTEGVAAKAFDATKNTPIKKPKPIDKIFFDIFYKKLFIFYLIYYSNIYLLSIEKFKILAKNQMSLCLIIH